MKWPDRRLLLINYYFPPIRSIGTLRNYNIYREALRETTSVKVITTNNRDIFEREDWSFREEDVYPVPTLDYRRILHLFRKNRSTHFSESVKKGWVKQLIRLQNSFPFNLLLGEGGLWYIIHAYRVGCQLIKEGKVTHIWSSYMPYADHFIAYLLKRRFPELYWIADFRDLHIDPIRQHTVGNSFQRWCNKKVLAQADLVTTVSAGLAKQIRQLGKEVEVLRNAIPEEAFQSSAGAGNLKKFTIAYTGSVYQNLQTAEPLFQALRQLIDGGRMDKEDIQINYAGKDGDSWQQWARAFGLEKILETWGIVSHTEALYIQRVSHLNVVLSWSGPGLSGILTGKVYEYLAAGQPILAMVNGPEEEEFENCFEEWNAGYVYCMLRDDPEQLKAYILQLYQEWKNTGKVNSPIRKEALKDLKRSTLFRRLMELSS